MFNYQHILLPVDFSESNILAAKQTGMLAEFNNAKVTLLHVVNYLPPRYISIELPAKLSSSEFVTSEARAHLNEWSKQQNMAEHDQVIEVGSPKKIILALTEKLGIDLIVLSPNKESGLVRLFGSVTNAVAQTCKCSVLIVK